MLRRDRRSKVISIRVSEREFNQMQELCSAMGLDNLSELARAAVKLLVVQDGTPDRIEVRSRVSEIQARMGLLDREIERISSRIGLPRLEDREARPPSGPCV